jgi:RhoGEF domain
VKPASLPVNTLGNAVASTKETVIPQQERKIVFNGLDSLFSFHTQSFLPALENAAMPLLRASSAEADVTGEISMTAATSIANVFVSHAAFMRMYSTYIK